MKKMKFNCAILLVVFLISCSNKENKQEETAPEQKVATVDTTNILIATVSQNGKYGYINTEFKMVITPQFDGAMRFNEGLGCVKVGDKWGFINIKGEFVIKPSFHDPGVFYDGLAKVGNMVGNGNGSSRYFYINKEGANVFNREFRFGEDFNNGIAMVKDESGKETFITLKGETVTDGPPLLYNHFKHNIKPYGGELSKSIVLDPKTGNPSGIKYDKSNMGYADEFGRQLTEAVYSSAGEFYFSFKTPAQFFSTNKDENTITSMADLKPDSLLTSVIATYKKTELLDSDEGGVRFTFVQEDGKELILNGYNPKSKLIPLEFICGTCTPDNTKKYNVGRKFTVKYYVQKAEGENGSIEENKIFEWFDIPDKK